LNPKVPRCSPTDRAPPENGKAMPPQLYVVFATYE